MNISKNDILIVLEKMDLSFEEGGDSFQFKLVHNDHSLDIQILKNGQYIFVNLNYKNESYPIEHFEFYMGETKEQIIGELESTLQLLALTESRVITKKRWFKTKIEAKFHHRGEWVRFGKLLQPNPVEIDHTQTDYTHHPYSERLNHEADFRVKYRFFSPEEGGRQVIPHQGYRSDFWYNAGEEMAFNQVFMIWPEFEDENGDLILRSDIPVPVSGIARMWVVDPKRREFHSKQIEVGVQGYFKEASMSSAECEVIEILGLQTNPRE